MVLCILVLVAWALFRPFAEIVRSIAGELRQIGKHRLRVSASAVFTVGIIVFIITAILLSSDWPAAAKPVPLTACYMALVAACLNLLNEVFGKEQSLAARGNVDGGVADGSLRVVLEAAQHRQGRLRIGAEVAQRLDRRQPYLKHLVLRGVDAAAMPQLATEEQGIPGPTQHGLRLPAPPGDLPPPLGVAP